MFKGSIVAIVTPFDGDKLDEQKLRDLVNFQVENGTHGIVPCGTTGESPTLSHAEHDRVVEIVVEAVAGRIPVIAGTGSNSTAEAVRLTQKAAKAGADGALVVTPYYNKPTQRGLFQHFKAVADSVDIPIVLYNIEGRTARNIETETVAKLASECKNIIGVKEASGNLQQVKEVHTACGPDFIILSGDDALTIPIMELGGKGVISVAANIIPRDIATLVETYARGDAEAANDMNEKILNLAKALFIETNPVPVKAACEMLGLCSGDVRLPLCRLEDGNLEFLKKALAEYGLGVNV